MAADEPGALEEIIVTAEKISANVQDIPISIATLSGDQILQAGVQETRDLARLVPGLDVQFSSGGGSSFFIRGIGSLALNAYGDPAVAFSTDGVYFSRPYGPNTTLYDVERVEVLKGPQGTLYGRNATSGAINVITRKPELSAFTGEAGVEGGNYGLIKLNGALNAPLGDIAAVRIAAQSVEHDGYLTDGYDNADNQAARVHLLVEPNDSASLLFTAHYAQDNSKGTGYMPIGSDFVVSGDPWTGPTDPRLIDYSSRRAHRNGVFENAGPGATVGRFATVGTDGDVNNEIYGANADLTLNLGSTALTFLPAYLKTEVEDNTTYFGGSGQNVTNEAEQTSAELRFSSDESGAVKWIVGAFYLNEEQKFFGDFEGTNPLIGFNLTWPDIKDEAWAAFGQASLSVTDTFRLTGGVRYSEEHKTSDDGTFRVNTANYIHVSRLTPPFFPPPPTLLPSPAIITVPSLAPTPPTVTIPSNGDQKFDSFDYRAGVEWDVAGESMLYATVSTAFHAGGLNPGADSYPEEELTAYSIGSKNRFGGDRVQLNVEAYYWDYDDLHVNHLGPLANPAGVPIFGARTDTAGSARLYGADLELNLLATPRDLVTFNVLYNNTKYEEFSFTNQVAVIFPPVTSDFSGSSFPNAPEWQGTFGYQHTFDLGSGEIVAGLRSRFSSEWFGALVEDDAVRDEVTQDSYTRTDVELTYNSGNGMWSITAYVRNVEDEAVFSTAQANNPADHGTWAAILPPRTYGGIVYVRF